MAPGTSNADVREWLRLHGLSSEAFVENRPSAPDAIKAERRAALFGLSPALQLSQLGADTRRARKLRAREVALSEGCVDGCTATPEEVTAELRRLGIDDPQLAAGFRPRGQDLARRPEPPGPASVAREDERRLRRVEDRAREAGRGLDARTLSDGAYRALLRRLGLSAPGPWGVATRAPQRR